MIRPSPARDERLVTRMRGYAVSTRTPSRETQITALGQQLEDWQVISVLDRRRGALLGVIGPLVFLVGVVLVSWSERDFMAELGWEHWPSGTALGPHGWATVLVFLLTGLCQMGFALALFAQAGGSVVRKLGAGLLLVSGFGMAMLAFKTDRPDAESTWHGFVHGAAYAAFFFGLLLSYLFLAWGSWKRLERSSWVWAPLALLPWLGVFLLPGGLAGSNYLFFAILLTPQLILALRVLATGGWPSACRAVTGVD